MKKISKICILFYEAMIEAFEMRAQYYDQNKFFSYYI
jgi:hypothetical protein